MTDEELIEYYGKDDFVTELCKQYGQECLIPVLKMKEEGIKRQKKIRRYEQLVGI